MEIIIFGLVLYVGYRLWHGLKSGNLLNIHIPFATNRGLLAVKAAWFIILKEDGATTSEANTAVANLDENMPTDMIFVAKDVIDMRYDGKQLPMINDARNRGFTG